MRKQITMKDIAEAMGVSIVTVSKALAGKEGVSEELREDIIIKAEELGYLAKEERKRRSTANPNIAILISESFVDENSFYTTIYQKMIMELNDRDFIGILEIVRREDEQKGNLPKTIRTKTVAQAIIIGEMKTEYLERIRESGTDMIFFDFENADFDVDTIVSDNLNGGYAMTRYLAKKGYKDIAFVGNIRATGSILDRFLGHIKYKIAKGLYWDVNWVIPDRDEDNHDIDIILPENMPGAFFCNCDKTAYRTIYTLEQAGYRVPEDVAVVGYDDYAPHIPGGMELTTYKVNTDEMIHHCVHIVHQRSINPSYRRGNTLVRGELVERNTVRDIR